MKRTKTKPTKTNPTPKPKPKSMDDYPVKEDHVLADTLRGMVEAAEASGGRDRPEVMNAREVLAQHGH